MESHALILALDWAVVTRPAATLCAANGHIHRRSVHPSRSLHARECGKLRPPVARARIAALAEPDRFLPLLLQAWLRSRLQCANVCKNLQPLPLHCSASVPSLPLLAPFAKLKPGDSERRRGPEDLAHQASWLGSVDGHHATQTQPERSELVSGPVRGHAVRHCSSAAQSKPRPRSQAYAADKKRQKG